MKRLVLVLALGLLGCFSGAESKAVTASELTPYERAAAYSKEFRGLSVLIIKDGKTVFEEYQNGHGADKAQMLASGTKSFSGVMLAAAIEDGIVKGFDEKISDTITEWKADPAKSAVTVRDLLTLTSGIDPGSFGRVPAYKDAIKNNFNYPNREMFQYGPAPFQVFGEFMTRKLKSKNETVEAYLKRRILDPIGLKVARWTKQGDQINLPSGAFLTAREWSKFGILLLNDGKWNGKQIVGKELLRQLRTGSTANENYGVTFWLNKQNDGRASVPEPKRKRMLDLLGIEDETTKAAKEGFGKRLPKDVYVAAGAGKQRLYVFPTEKMVIVRQGRQSKFDDERFLELALGIARK
ncbi:MAG: serine hydrolase [Pyrinomonadaceae bacterium]